MKKRILRLAALLLALVLIAGVCWFANGLVGNPISKILATRTAESYLRTQYPNTDYRLDGVVFSFKITAYHAYISSPSSPDSSFTLRLGMDGKLQYDYYQEHVVNRGNTARRLGEEYRLAVDKVLGSPAFPYACDIGFGDLEFISEAYKGAPGVPPYALVTDTLKLDGLYDIQKLGAQAGKLTLYIQSDTVSVVHLAEVLLELKDIFDTAGVSFYLLDCVLEYPKPEEGPWPQDRVEVMDFLYADIYEEGLVERVRASNDAARKYYDTMDAIKKEN